MVEFLAPISQSKYMECGCLVSIQRREEADYDLSIDYYCPKHDAPEIEYKLLCGCEIIIIGGFHGIDYCPRHDAANMLYAATRIAEQLAGIATDWNLTEAEIDGEMVSVYELRQ